MSKSREELSKEAQDALDESVRLSYIAERAVIEEGKPLDCDEVKAFTASQRRAIEATEKVVYGG